MTFNKAALAIDGALINSALVRTEAYANASGEEGVIQKNDLKVSALTVPGQGVRIGAGAALVLNRYQATPNQMYTVTNPGEHTVGSASMPSANVSAMTYVVAVAVGDPEFSASGHPYMVAGQPSAGQEATFEYVRPIVVTKAAFDARTYPAVALAEIAIPANTTTIQPGYITDVRKLARPRTKIEVANVAGPGAANPLNGGGGTPGTYERWPNVGVLTVTVPSWAVKAKIMGFVEGAILSKAGTANLRAYVEGTSLVTPVTNINETAPVGTDRVSYNFGGELDVTSVAGQSKTFSVQATPTNTASKGALTADGNTSVAIMVYFEEQPT